MSHSSSKPYRKYNCKNTKRAQIRQRTKPGAFPENDAYGFHLLDNIVIHLFRCIIIEGKQFPKL